MVSDWESQCLRGKAREAPVSHGVDLPGPAGSPVGQAGPCGAGEGSTVIHSCLHSFLPSAAAH